MSDNEFKLFLPAQETVKTWQASNCEAAKANVQMLRDILGSIITENPMGFKSDTERLHYAANLQALISNLETFIIQGDNNEK